MTGAMVERQLDHRRIALANMVNAQFAGSRLTATSRFFRLFVQSAALGLGALLAIAGNISAGAIIASSVLLSRALQPIESIIGAWSSLAMARAADVPACPARSSSIGRAADLHRASRARRACSRSRKSACAGATAGRS